jgi:hypothetical protein
VGVVERELLGDGAAEGDAENVDSGMSERVEEMSGLARDAVHTYRHESRWGIPGARRVVRDGLDAARVEASNERIPHFDVAPDAHDEEQRRTFALNRYPHQVAVDADEREDPLHFWST